MIVEFDDNCWISNDKEWNRRLVELLTLLANREQHALQADSDLMIPWCSEYLSLHVDYFKTRLASAQARANAVKVKICPTGQDQVTADPPWNLTAQAAYDIVNRPLRLVLENDNSDRLFVQSTVPSFSAWCDQGWIAPAMGGGTAMEKDIVSTSNDIIARWRTFYMFDSDRLHPLELAANWSPPGGDGCQGYRFELKCVNMPAQHWHRLRRRSIENYLPESVLSVNYSSATSVLFRSSVGDMVNFYNFKDGLTGDGISPVNPKKVIRAGRSQGFWGGLPAQDIVALQNGFGSSISLEFANIPVNHPWPAEIIAEMNKLSDALQDAI